MRGDATRTRPPISGEGIVRESGSAPPGADLHAVFPGDSEMAVRCRAFDWAATPLGPVSDWSHSLRTTVGIVLTSRQPMFLFWGPALVQVYNDAYRPSLGTGGRADRALGASGREFWTEIWDAIGPQIDQVMTTGEPTWHEDQHLPIERNGRLEDVWWTYSYSPVRDDDGSIAATLVVCQETTDRVLADRARLVAIDTLAAERAQLRSIVDRAPAFIAVLRGPEHRFERINAEYDRLVGGRAKVGQTVAEALPEVVEQGFIELLDRVLATGEPFVGHAVPVRLVHSPGGAPVQRYVDFVYQALTEADGSRSGVFVHGVDVTDVVEGRQTVEHLLEVSEAARADAEEARAEAEAASRAKSDFLATMSHELRTPLNAIGGYAELIELGLHGPVTDAQRDALWRIQQSQRHLLGLIAGVLDYSRVEAGAVAFRFDEVPVLEAMAEAEALVAPQIRAKGLLYSSSCESPDLSVRADREKLQQILLNLLGNAIKFTHQRGDTPGRIDVSCHAVDTAAGPIVSFRVRDTGQGIGADEIDRIFEPFVQADQRLTRPHGGVGLGLAISRDLARGMGGDLVAESIMSEGSTFTLTLPRS